MTERVGALEALGEVVLDAPAPSVTHQELVDAQHDFDLALEFWWEYEPEAFVEISRKWYSARKNFRQSVMGDD